MALTKCEDCGQEVSTRAAACPKLDSTMFMLGLALYFSARFGAWWHHR